MQMQFFIAILSLVERSRRIWATIW